MASPVPDRYDFVVVGAGSAGAVVAARLSEDPKCRVALLEAGGDPSPHCAMPLACAFVQLSEHDWKFLAKGGNGCQGLVDKLMHVPRGKQLGGTSGMNYMQYTRGHPGDYDEWQAQGASGWSYADVLPYFKKAECIKPGTEKSTKIDAAAHGTDGPIHTQTRAGGVLPGSTNFVAACKKSGLPMIDYNGRSRGGPKGGVSHTLYTTKQGKRCGTYPAYLKPLEGKRKNLTVITNALARKVLFETHRGPAIRAAGVEYSTGDEVKMAQAAKEVIVCCGAIQSPQVLQLSGIGPRAELEKMGVRCIVDSPHVGKHLRDHLMVKMLCPAPGSGIRMDELLPCITEEQRGVKEWEKTGKGYHSTSLIDCSAFMSSGVDGADMHAHDIQIIYLLTGYIPDIWKSHFRTDCDEYFEDPADALGVDKESVIFLPINNQMHSEGSVTLASTDPAAAPVIDFGYFTDPHDVKVFRVSVRKCLEIAGNYDPPIQYVYLPKKLAKKHGLPHKAPISTELPDAFIDDWAEHHAVTVYHATSTCRIGQVVDPRLRVNGVAGLRVADASVFPNNISGNTNAACIMTGEKCAEMVAKDHGLRLRSVVNPAEAVRAPKAAAPAGGGGDRRADPTTTSNKTYTKEQFEKFYQDGGKMWRKAGGKLAVPAKAGTGKGGAEKRPDPTTNSKKGYTKAQFEQFYQDGGKMWKKAGKALTSR